MDELNELICVHLKSKSLFCGQPLWTIKDSKISGRGLFATRDISSGEVIFKDHTLIIGPRASMGCPTICVSCYENKNLYLCSRKCGLPVCSAKCEESEIHRNECELISKWNNRNETLEMDVRLLKCLTPIRSLFLNDNQKKLLFNLKSHAGHQHGFEVDILEQKLNLHFTDDERNVMKATCTILDANSFEVVVGNEEHCSGLRGLYPLSSLMNHTCVPNTMHIFDGNQTMIVKATTFIPKGEEIFHSYTRIIWGTPVRRMHLARTKHFICLCLRCQDPSDFGTNLSALRCLKCNENVLPFFGDNGLSVKWKCTGCEELMSPKKAATITSILGSRLNSFGSSETDVLEMLEFLKVKLPRHVPSLNQIVVELKYKLIWILGYQRNHLWNGEFLLKKLIPKWSTVVTFTLGLFNVPWSIFVW